jgi:hypothetical protein
MEGVVISAEVALAEVTLAGTMGGAAVATAGALVVTAGVAADHMVVGIAAVGTVVPMGMAAAGTGTEVVRIGTETPPTGGVILTVTALLTTNTSEAAPQTSEI